MSDEKPPPYSLVIAAPLVKPHIPEFPDPGIGLPFSHSDRLATKILALVCEGKTLDSHFKDVRDVASAATEFEHQEHALILCQRFETLLWESRNTAGVVLVAIRDFNEVVLDFLSEPDVVVQDRLKELTNASKLVQQERGSATGQKSSFNALIKELEDFHQMIHLGSGSLVPKRRKRSHSGGRGINGARPARKSRFPFVATRPEVLNGLSTVTVSLGAISRTCMDYALQFERMAEQAVFPSLVASSPPESSAPPGQDTNTGPVQSNALERKRLPPIEPSESPALDVLIGALRRDLCEFASRLDVFDTVFAELARAQDIFVVYLKDGQSASNQGYRSEIKRLRRCLPCVCNALDAYSKARLS